MAPPEQRHQVSMAKTVDDTDLGYKLLIAGDLAVEFLFNKLMRRVESTTWALELLVAAPTAARTLLNSVLKLILSLSLDTNDPIEVSDQLS